MKHPRKEKKEFGISIDSLADLRKIKTDELKSKYKKEIIQTKNQKERKKIKDTLLTDERSELKEEVINKLKIKNSNT